MLCYVCNNKINSYNTIYKGFDMNFCSNICRTKIYNKIVIHDSNIKKYNEWTNICNSKTCNENKKVKKACSIKDLYSLDSIKIENNENIVEKFENSSDYSSDTYNNINIYNFISSNNSFYYINCLNNQKNKENQKNQENQENTLDKNILIFTKNLKNNLDYSIITKYIIYPVILFCKYIYK